MALTGLVFRLIKGSGLTAFEGDANLRILRDGINAVNDILFTVLKPNGTLKDGAVGSTSVLADGVVTLAKLAADAKFPPGAIVPFGGDAAPAGWFLCDGTAKSRTGDTAALFSAIGVKWGVGDGSTTFNLPDLRGYTVVGSGATGALTNRNVGQKFGEENHVLTVPEIPAHSHTYQKWHTGVPYFDDPLDGTNNDGGNESKQTDSTGGGQGHNNLQPSAYCTWIVKQ